jgi:hypothetical protein
MGEIINILQDPDYGDVIDPINGRDLKVTLTPEDKSKGIQYNQYKILPKPNKSKLHDDETIYNKLLNNQVDLK